MKRRLALLFGGMICLPLLAAAETPPLKPGPRDKCPVCGMFVAKYPEWVAAVRFADGATFFFDGVKDLMKFHFNLTRYAPGRSVAEIEAVRVTDYYRLEMIDGRRAFYVAGSDVTGPMGRELIPFEKEADAEEFMRDHRGQAVLRFDQIDPERLKTLD